MNLFTSFRPLLRIATALERIAHALEYFAIHDARKRNVMFMIGKPPLTDQDESELLHTDDSVIRQMREEAHERFIQRGEEDE